tara:strand:- start:464 stop:751 length:288 start_codon:yes stop_codon:yes gene_type:complete
MRGINKAVAVVAVLGLAYALGLRRGNQAAARATAILAVCVETIEKAESVGALLLTWLEVPISRPDSLNRPTVPHALINSAKHTEPPTAERIERDK